MCQRGCYKKERLLWPFLFLSPEYLVFSFSLLVVALGCRVADRLGLVVRLEEAHPVAQAVGGRVNPVEPVGGLVVEVGDAANGDLGHHVLLGLCRRGRGLGANGSSGRGLLCGGLGLGGLGGLLGRLRGNLLGLLVGELLLLLQGLLQLIGSLLGSLGQLRSLLLGSLLLLLC